MKESFRVCGYPISQLVISGLIAGVFAIPIVVLWMQGKSIHPALILATVGIIVICIVAVLAQPFTTISVDVNKEIVTVRWILFCGIISRSRKLNVKDIQKLVYGVITSGQTFRARPGRTTPSQSKHSFYAQMASGAHEFLLPKSKASPGLSHKLGKSLSEYLNISFVRYSSGSGHFKEELIQ